MTGSSLPASLPASTETAASSLMVNVPTVRAGGVVMRSRASV
jgi:hypothetical protein